MEGTDVILSSLYTQHPHLIDPIIYLLLFMGIAQVTLGRQYTGRGGRAITIGVGLSLTITASVSAYRAGFKLDRLAPISWILLGVVLLTLMLAVLSMPVWRRTRSSSDRPQHPDRPPSARGHSFSFHLHTDRPGPGWWRRRSCPSNAETAAAAHRVTGSMHRSESAVSMLLDAFAEHAAMHGLDRHPESFLIAIARTQRTVDHAYHTLLTVLARSGWRSDPEKYLLSKDVESVIKRVSQHTALFHEAMRFAEAAIHGGNLQLLRESIARMQMLEQDSIRLTRLLQELIERIHAEHAASATSSSSGASSTTRGQDAG